LARKRFDDNAFSESLTDAEASIADLANDAALTAEKLDLLLFAKSHLAKAMSYIRGRGQLLDANGDASVDLAQGAKERLRTIVRVVFVCH
jgi:hypothetical protein